SAAFWQLPAHRRRDRHGGPWPLQTRRKCGLARNNHAIGFTVGRPYRLYCLKYRKSGGGWSSLAGIKRPSPRRTYISLPMATNPVPSTQLLSRQSGRGFELCTYFLSTVQGRVKAWSITVTSS